MGGEVSGRNLVERIRDGVLAAQALRPPPSAGLTEPDRMADDPRREYLNNHFVLKRPALPRDAAGRGLRGRMRARAAHFVRRLLDGYFDDEQEFLANLVRLQNTIAAHIDRLSTEVRQLESLLQAESERLRSTDMTLHTRLEDRVRALELEVEALREERGGT